MSTPTNLHAKAAHPFAQLMGVAVGRLPHSPAVELVVNGKRVTDARQLNAQHCPLTADEADEADPQTLKAEASEARRLKVLLEAARGRARYPVGTDAATHL